MGRRHSNTTPLRIAKWLGTTAGIAGAIIIAANIGFVALGFVLFLISSVLWCTVSWAQREASLFVLQATFSLVNVAGIYRWLGT